MTLHPGAGDNSDCDLVSALWRLLDDPNSGAWYLGSIIRNGLDDPGLGIDLPAFPTIPVGDVPEQTMFEWALEHLAISMSATELTGLDSYQGGTLTCTPVSGTQTDVELTLRFGAVTFRGGYDVGASGVTGCAIATAATLLGNPPSAAGAGESEDSRLGLAAWYRDDPKALAGTSTGQLAVGTYYLHEDTIEKVTTSSAASQYRQTLAKQKKTADAVTDSTRYWKRQQTGEDPPGPPPKVGQTAQYGGGFQSYVYLNKAVDKLRQDAGLALEPGNEYADLQNAMAQFNAQVLDFQRKHSGERDTAEIMRYVTSAEPVAPEALEELEIHGIPVHDHATGDVVEHVTPWPIDRERAMQAYAARAPRTAAPEDWFHVKGTFSDRAQGLSAGFTVQFVSEDGEKLFATVTATKIAMDNLNITLGNKSGFDSQPGLYDKTATWIANTQSFQDTLKSKVDSALNTRESLALLTNALNAGLKKLGLQ